MKRNKRNNDGSPKPQAAPPAPRLPLMKTFEDAEALWKQEQDPFYLAAFLIQCWLGGLVQRAAAEYAENKNPRDRSLQRGEAWRSFLELFGSTAAKGHRCLLSCLFRFSASDNSAGNSLRRALIPLSIEHHCTGDYFGPKTMQLLKSGSANSQLSTLNSQLNGNSQLSSLNPQLHDLNDLCRRTIIRWCDWLDAAVHLRTHRRWHVAPACFDPDPEIRYLASLGNAQRHIASLDFRAQIAWAHDFVAAAEVFKNSPKWTALAKGMSAAPDRLWAYPEVDTHIIALWPLVTRYNWTYRDLMNVVRTLVERANAYPCGGEQEFAAYCVNSLGLRKTSKGVSANNGCPAGFEIARQFCPGIEQKQTKAKRSI